MKNLKNLFLVRHAAYRGRGDAHISEEGKDQSSRLGKSIRKVLGQQNTAIWTSSANKAKETAEIIKSELSLAEVFVHEKLWSDDSHDEDYYWLKKQLEGFEGENLIIVTHSEYVRDFPSKLGFSTNDAEYASGVLISNGKCELFN